jgi:3-hydroxybutyryl-CoA dehydratase
MLTIRERTHFDIGEEASLTRTIGEADVAAYARISGDENPIHLDETYAQGTRFGGRIVHGMLIAGLISAVLGNKLPGPGAIYLSQILRFTAPVRVSETVTVRVRVTEWDEIKGRITLLTEVVNQNGAIVITGEAKLVMSAFLK